MHYSNMQNERACTFISGKVCILGSIKVRIQTLPEINVHARLFGTLEYCTKYLERQFDGKYIHM